MRCTGSLPILHGTPRLMAGLLYGSGLRLMECVRLRVKDIDFGYARITVRDGKGGKDRVTMLPINLAAPLQRHLATLRARRDPLDEETSWPPHPPLSTRHAFGPRAWLVLQCHIEHATSGHWMCRNASKASLLLCGIGVTPMVLGGRAGSGASKKSQAYASAKRILEGARFPRPSSCLREIAESSERVASGRTRRHPRPTSTCRVFFSGPVAKFLLDDCQAT